ncbi:phosphoribosylaminoimidazolesuccinocarboxamide synthase, partial [Streptococcus danieliae]|nr:phosphoribosylaminoimidazolesuccinocarboxamide synthase [Streptococcus danieliae]
EETYYKSDALDDPFINESQTLALGLATKAELTEIWELSRKTNQLLTALFAKADLTLVDFKLEFGRLSDGTLVLADEFSPDNCRLWDKKTKA